MRKPKKKDMRRFKRKTKKISDYLSSCEAAAMIGVTKTTLRNWDIAGKLTSQRNPINNYRLYNLRDIEKFLKKLENSGSPRK